MLYNDPIKFLNYKKKNLQLLNIFHKEQSWVVVFLFHHLCKYTSSCTAFSFQCPFCAFPFFCRRRRGACLLTYCTILRRQLFGINLQLLNIFHKEQSWVVVFLFHHLCKYIHLHAHQQHSWNTNCITIGKCFYATTDFHLVTSPLTILRNLQGKMGHAWSWTFLCQSRFVAEPPSK